MTLEAPETLPENQPETPIVVEEDADELTEMLELEIAASPANQPEVQTADDSTSGLVVKIAELESDRDSFEAKAAQLRLSGDRKKAKELQATADELSEKLEQLQAELREAEAAESNPRAALETQLAEARGRKDQAKKARNLQGMKAADAEIKEIEAKLADLAESEPPKPDPKVALETELADAQRRMDEEWAKEEPDMKTLEAIEAEMNNIKAKIAGLTESTPQTAPAPQAQTPIKPAAQPVAQVTTKLGSNGHAKTSLAAPVQAAPAPTPTPTVELGPTREVVIAALDHLKDKGEAQAKSYRAYFAEDRQKDQKPLADIVRGMQELAKIKRNSEWAPWVQ